MAGHSKWKQIKHKKAVTDAKKAQIFSKLVREIMVAARSGGINPAFNSRLRTALDRARSDGLPKDNVERALERATGEGEAGKLQEFLYEATAPGGIAILIEGITDNKNRSLSEIKHILAEHGGKLAEQGSLVWNFDKIGTIEILRQDNLNKSPGEIELAIIDSGADNFSAHETGWTVETEFSSNDRVRHALEAAGVSVSGSGHDYKPKTTIVPGGSGESLGALLDSISDHEDVQEVYTNLATG